MAVQLQPELSEVHLAQGHYRYRVLRDFDGAAQAFEAALKQSPNDALTLQSLGLVERRQGHWDRAITHLEQAAMLDPRNVGLMTAIGGETYSNLNRYDEERQWLDRALAIESDDAMAIGYKAFSYMFEGRLDDAARVLDPLPVANANPNVAVFRIYLRILQRRNAEAIAEARSVLARPDEALDGYRTRIAVFLGFAQLRAGDAAAARDTFAAVVTRTEPAKDHVDDTLVPVDRALALAGAGLKDEALKQARHAVDLYASDAIWRPYAEATLIQVQGMSR